MLGDGQGQGETRRNFRSVRVGRITVIEALDERFRDAPGRSLADLMRRHAADGVDCGRFIWEQRQVANARPPPAQRLAR